MYGWIVYNGFLKSNKFIDFAQMLSEAALRRGHHIKCKTNKEIAINLFQTNEMAWPDYVLFTDKDIYLAKQLENQGIKVFNSAAAIEVSDDKIKTYQCLQKNDITIPKTRVLPKTFGLKLSADADFINDLMRDFDFPVVVKEAFGSFGEQVYLIENQSDLVDILDKVSDKPAMIQTFIASSYGTDLRLQVVGNKVIAAMKRSSEKDFRANITSGGKMWPYEPTKAEQSIAVKASQAINADFSGVDILIDENKMPVVCEVNSNAHIRNLLDCTGVNVAPAIIEHIEGRLKGMNV